MRNRVTTVDYRKSGILDCSFGPAKPLIRKLCGVGNTAAFSLLPTPITSAT
jgi:hypothetical protein